jgi:hypothetical protein
MELRLPNTMPSWQCVCTAGLSSCTTRTLHMYV